MDTATQAADEQALLTAARHDLQHFAPIYERYFPRIYAYCLRRVSDVQEAEDLASQIFTNAMTHLDGYRGGLVAAWLFRIAHNAVINHVKQTPAVPFAEVPDSRFAGGDPSEVVIEAERDEQLRRLVLRLPSEQQDLLLMKVVGGLSAEEIGAVLGKRAGTVRVALHRALRQLYTMSQENEGGLHHA